MSTDLATGSVNSVVPTPGTGIVGATTSLHRVVYVSRSTIDVTPDEMRVHLRQILAASTRNNAEVGVTGALMFNAGCFAQVLEGPLAAIDATFERI